MKRIRFAAMMSVVVGVLLSRCAGWYSMPPEEILSGTWQPEESVAVYRIEVVDGEIQMSGHSSQSGMLLIIRDVQWDGEVLRFVSYLAATDTEVVHENRITGRNTMTSSIVSNRRGYESSHTKTWNRIEDERMEENR